MTNQDQMEIAKKAQMTYTEAVALGFLDGNMNKFGEKPVLNIADSPADIWDGTGAWAAPTEARIHTLVSSSASDTQTIAIEGLNDDYELVIIIVTLTGDTPLPMTTALRMIHRMTILIGVVAVGTITATAAVDATVTAQISIGKGQTEMCIFMIPKDGGVVSSYDVAAEAGTPAATLLTFKFRYKLPTGPWATIHRIIFDTSNDNNGDKEWRHGQKFMTAGTLIKLTATTNKDASYVSGAFDLIYFTRTFSVVTS